MAKKYIKHKLYKIRFYDHCIGDHKGPVVCEVCGWILSEDATELKLTYWVVDTADDQVKKDNIEPISIIKSCIIRSRKLS